MAHLFSSLDLTPPGLRALGEQFMEEMLLGLSSRGQRENADGDSTPNLGSTGGGGASSPSSSLKMIPSFVSTPKPPPQVQASVPSTAEHQGGLSALALDLGGTNFRIARLALPATFASDRGSDALLGGGSADSVDAELRNRLFICQETISDAAMSGGAEDLFDFIASAVKSFLDDAVAGEDTGSAHDPTAVRKHETAPLGFTFSFPVNQTACDAGTLIAWTKGFTTRGVVGKDVVALLNDALKRKHVEADVRVLLSDTVATLAAGAFVHPNCGLGVILGTGTNAAYLERSIPNLPDPDSRFDVENDGMIINIEWGAFGDRRAGAVSLPLTDIDRELDRESKHPGTQSLEKLIGGFYLGEICRRAFSRLDLPATATPFLFESRDLRTFADDKTTALEAINRFAVENWNCSLTEKQRNECQEVCHAVLDRAAKLTAVAICTVARRVRAQHPGLYLPQVPVGVAIDGSVFEGQPRFRRVLADCAATVFPDSPVEFFLVKDGSSIGAAVLAGQSGYIEHKR